MAPPLISEYKRGFVLKRLVETFLGGPRLFSPPLFITIQIVLFTLPAILVSLVNLDGKSDLAWKCVVTGCTIFLFDFSLALIILLLKRGRNMAQIMPSVRISDPDGENGTSGENHNVTSFLSQEDMVFNFWKKGKSENYLTKFEKVPSEGCHKPSTWIFIAPNIALSIQYIVVLLLSSFSFLVCTPLMISQKVNPVLRGLTIFAVCNARYSAVISSPPEIANFDTTFPEKKHVLYRPFYTALVGVSYVIFAQFSQDPDEHCVITSLSVVLALLPLLWGCGILPPLDALLPWGLGMLLLILGGTSPSFHYAGTLISLIIVVICPILVFIISQESLKIVLAECLCGYIIACDTGRIIALKPSLCAHTPTKSFLNQLLYPIINILTSLTCVLITWLNVEQNDSDIFLYKIVFASTTLTISLLSFTFRYFTMTITPRKKVLLIPVHILYGLITFILHIWLTLSIEHDKIEWSSVKESVSHSLMRLVPYLLAIRGFALAVTEPRKSTIDFCLAFCTQLLYYEEGKSSFVLILFISSLITSRIRRFFRHWKSICSIFYAFCISTIMDGKKVKILVMAGILLPISMFSLMVVIMVEGMTIIPIFTLPIFLMGFPRPTTFWKEKWYIEKASKGKGLQHLEVETIDMKIYSEIGTLLACAISKKAHVSKFSLERGDCFLARYEDRLLFVRVISSGWNFAYLQIKGLEMQEQTSCHHQEAAKIDETFDAILSKSRSTCSKLSVDFLSLLMLSPMCTLKLPTYSESKSNISCLSTAEEKSAFRDMFYRAFSYLWIKNNPALKGESYQKGLPKTLPPLGAGGRMNIVKPITPVPADDLPPIEASDNAFSQNPPTNVSSSSGEFSVKNALMKSLNFMKKMEVGFGSSKTTVVSQGPSPIGEEESPDASPVGAKTPADFTEDKADSGEESGESQVPPKLSRKKFSILSRQSTTTSLASIPQNNGSRERRCSVSSPTPARLVDVESVPFVPLPPQRNNASLEMGGSERLSSVFVKQCVGDVIPSNAVRARVEKICNSVWDTVIGIDDDKEIDLSLFFQDDFLQQLKKLSTSPRVDVEQITLKALRYACKLALDEMFSTNYSSASKVITIDGDMEEEIFTQLTLFEREHQFCSTQEIPYHLKQNANRIITMNKNEDNKSAVMRILNYEVEGVEFKLGRLDQFTAEGIWANLNLELLYLTSDDDERFSIQNDRVLLRNIITESAKTPLGYPVYEALFRVNLHDFTVKQIE